MLKPESKRSNSILLNDENVSIFDTPYRANKKDYTHESINQFIWNDVDVEDELEIFEGCLIKNQKSGFCRLIYKSGLFIEGNFE